MTDSLWFRIGAGVIAVVLVVAGVYLRRRQKNAQPDSDFDIHRQW